VNHWTKVRNSNYFVICFNKCSKSSGFNLFFAFESHFISLKPLKRGLKMQINFYPISGIISKMLKAKQFGIKSLLRVGTQNSESMHPDDLSNVASLPESRKKFAKQLFDIVDKYNFDGVYIFWRFFGCPTVHNHNK